MSDTLRNSYEEVLYPDLCYTQTHPDRLATLARLLGLQPAPVAGCRVLELGCASGGNLIGMAYGLANSQFVGMDFSAAQIQAGQRNIASLGLTNITLLHQDILQLAPNFGKFDYIIAHGVYSWVPERVRDHLLAICKQSLAEHGIVYISYNTLPGWHMLGALREMMLYHTRSIEDPRQKVSQALGLLSFLAESVPSSEDSYGTFLSAYGDMIRAYGRFVREEREKHHSGYELILHDELEAVNEPVYFHQFADHAASHGLQYLVEADFARVMPTNFPAEVSQSLFKMSRNIIEVEQYMDFLRNRTLRQTLLCHAAISIQRALRPDPTQLSPFYIATYAQPDATDFDVYDSSVVRFRGPDGAALSTDHPVSKAAMLHLSRISPQAISFEALLEFARAQIYRDIPGMTDLEDQERDARTLAANILQAYSYSVRLVELHLHAPHFELEPSQRPAASRLARLQARNGNLTVTSLRHERVNLDPLSARLLPYLDGSHDRAALIEVLDEIEAQKHVDRGKSEQPTRAEEGGQTASAGDLEATLLWLGRAALLEA